MIYLCVEGEIVFSSGVTLRKGETLLIPAFDTDRIRIEGEGMVPEVYL